MNSKVPKSLLIVDDKKLIIDRLLDSLQGHEKISSIRIAENFEMAQIELIKQEPDILLLDIQLPGKNGIELLKHVVQDYPTIKVIMFSNLASEHYIKLCREIGAHFFVDKSTEFELIPGILAVI